MAKQIEHWPTERLAPYARNARTHSPAQVTQIAASIREFGFNAPILVDSKAGIIAGYGRLLAARELQLAQVPVIVLDHLSEIQKRAYMLADNRLAEEAGWDEDLLRAELAELQAAAVDLELLGFAADELHLLLTQLSQVDGGDQGVEQIHDPPLTPVTQAGDLWLIGPHRLLCGDCRDPPSCLGCWTGGPPT